MELLQFDTDSNEKTRVLIVVFQRRLRQRRPPGTFDESRQLAAERYPDPLPRDGEVCPSLGERLCSDDR